MPGRRRPSPVRLLAVVVAGLAVVLLAGCTSPGPDAAGAPRSRTTLPKYYDAGALLGAVTARERADVGALTRLNGTLDPPGTGASGAPAPTGRRALTGDGVLRVADGTTAVRFDQRLADTGGAVRTTTTVRTGGRTFLRLPGAADGSWTEIGRDVVDPAVRTDAALATNIAGMADPLAGAVRYSDAVLVADASDDQVDGRATVRYTLVVDLVRAAAAETDTGMRAQLTAQVAGGLTRISSEVWVDSDQRPVRTRIRQEVPGAGTLELVTDYRSWGTPVTIDPPPGR